MIEMPGGCERPGTAQNAADRIRVQAAACCSAKKPRRASRMSPAALTRRPRPGPRRLPALRGARPPRAEAWSWCRSSGAVRRLSMRRCPVRWRRARDRARAASRMLRRRRWRRCGGGIRPRNAGVRSPPATFVATSTPTRYPVSRSAPEPARRCVTASAAGSTGAVGCVSKP